MSAFLHALGNEWHGGPCTGKNTIDLEIYQQLIYVYLEVK